MEGLQKFFLKITPIIMLICFVCFGISHTFNAGNNNITYLTQETIQIDENTSIDQYKFDFRSYADNIDISILKRSTNQIIDIDTWQSTINSYNILWQDGYDIGDISQTILNSGILIIDGIIQFINITLVPWRIISGILLTGLSIIGININKETIIHNTLNSILDYAQIPLIAPVLPNGQLIYANTIWDLHAPILMTGDNFRIDVLFDAGYQTIGHYKTIEIIKLPQDKYRIYYTDTNNNVVMVCDQNVWQYADIQRIEILDTNTFDNALNNKIAKLLDICRATESNL